VSGSSDLLQIRLEGVVNSVGALTTSSAFSIVVYDDSSMSYMYHQDSSVLFYTTTVNTLQITSFTSTNTLVQKPCQLTTVFVFPDGLSDSSIVSTRLSVTLPSDIFFGASTLTAMKG
jgi:hypothetical protein